MGLLVSAARGAVPPRFQPLVKSARRSVLRVRYRGEGVVCPCCNGRFRAFRTAGVGTKREGALCPGCGSWERHRLLWLFLAARTSFFSEQLELLHVAPEPVLQQRFRALPNVSYTSIDLRSPLADLPMDVTELLFADGYFDAVICVHVLDHVSDDRKAMQELHRVLRPGGLAIVMCPTKRESTIEDPCVVSAQDRERIYGHRDRVRVYGPDLGDRLAAAGFDVEIVPYASELDPSTVERHGLLVSDDLYVLRKRAGASESSLVHALGARVTAARREPGEQPASP